MSERRIGAARSPTLPPLKWMNLSQGAVLGGGNRPQPAALRNLFCKTGNGCMRSTADGVFLCLREFARVMIEQHADIDPANSAFAGDGRLQRGPRAPRRVWCLRGLEGLGGARDVPASGCSWRAHGIRVNSVCPGTTRTPMVTDAWEGEDRSAPCPWRAALRPSAWAFRCGRIADPADIAAVNAFLISRGRTAHHHAGDCRRRRRDPLTAPRRTGV